MAPQIDTAQRRAERCSARVYDKWRIDVSGHQCTRAAKVEVEGKWYCGTHEPAAVKRRDQASYERYQQKYSNPLRYTEAELQAAKQQARRDALAEAVRVDEWYEQGARFAYAAMIGLGVSDKAASEWMERAPEGFKLTS